MAYNKEKLTKLEALQELAQRVEQEYATKESVTALSGRVDTLETAGGQPNVIETVKVNGVAQEVSEKAVDIKVPTKVSELSNDSAFQTNQQVAQASRPPSPPPATLLSRKWKLCPSLLPRRTT